MKNWRLNLVDGLKEKDRQTYSTCLLEDWIINNGTQDCDARQWKSLHLTYSDNSLYKITSEINEFQTPIPTDARKDRSI